MASAQYDLTVDFAECHLGERLAIAGAGDTFAGVDLEQGTMGGALDKVAFKVEKLVGLPFELDTPVGAAILIDEETAVMVYGDQCAAV
jgi:hypothetical protein